MNKGDAIRALHDGKKICHRHFYPSEWIGAKDGAYYTDEEGNCVRIITFWEARNSHSWEDGWSIWEARA